jgi:hypothetical protein
MYVRLTIVAEQDPPEIEKSISYFRSFTWLSFFNSCMSSGNRASQAELSYVTVTLMVYLLDPVSIMEAHDLT